MDLDAFAAVNSADWDTLDRLTRRRRLSGAEVDEMVQLYQRAATHLSVVRSSSHDPALVARLSGTVARARTRIAGGNEPITREFTRMFLVSFPAAVYRSRWWAFGAALGSTLVAVALGWWVAANPRVQASAGTEQQIQQLVQNDFENYYSEHAASGFAVQVWTNNAWVAALCFVLGITGVGVVYVLANNALNIGLVAGLMAANGRLDLFFGLITPHGLLELTCVFVAAGAGLQVFWAWVDPGPRSRARAVGEEGRAMVTIAIGLIVVLLVSGVVEAFVTPSPLPTWARIALGATVWLIFLGYVRYFGRPAVLTGETGDLAVELAGDVRPVAG
ncbi:stage II sporulation protein M [Kineosporia succinea]|uniref:Membrane protein SpoIIM required for sporulation n=1 Tax=Kineosporia succinea TaxID=84632 RepID=A0ABT9NY79_9ACTN|nr:stage II sporulation protein M [Kineosporia succinea]MDP9825393.1 putative membrane protein SpoIIM required for sporulation [Kineosporia succinea]